MALVVTNANQLAQFSGGLKIVTATVTLDTAYVAGGTAGLAGLLGLKTIYALIDVVSTGFIIDYFTATDLLKVLNSGGGGAGTKATEVANGNLSANQITVIAFGASA